MCINPLTNLHALRNTTFHHYNLSITSYRLNSRINKTLTTCHSVEEELLGRQTTHEGALYETTCLSSIIKHLVMGKRAIRKTIRDTTTLNRNLTEARNHLCYVGLITLGARTNHRHETILSRQTVYTNLSCIIRRLAENSNTLGLKLLLIALS